MDPTDLHLTHKDCLSTQLTYIKFAKLANMTEQHDPLHAIKTQ